MLNKFPIPDGFTEILHDFIKETIRYQPEDILQFGYDYFASLQTGNKNYSETKKEDRANSASVQGNATRQTTDEHFYKKEEHKINELNNMEKIIENNSESQKSSKNPSHQNTIQNNLGEEGSQNGSRLPTETMGKVQNFLDDVVRQSNEQLEGDLEANKNLQNTSEHLESKSSETKGAVKHFLDDVVRNSNEQLDEQIHLANVQNKTEGSN